MTAALSMLIILAIAVWLYQTAQQRGLPGVAWAIGGVIVYYGGFLLWMHGVLRQIPDSGWAFSQPQLWDCHRHGCDIDSVRGALRGTVPLQGDAETRWEAFRTFPLKAAGAPRGPAGRRQAAPVSSPKTARH
jgi:hypothetical protein